LDDRAPTSYNATLYQKAVCDAGSFKCDDEASIGMIFVGVVFLSEN